MLVKLWQGIPGCEEEQHDATTHAGARHLASGAARSGPARDMLTGDLVEQYQHGRSRAWYWWQVVVAIATSTLRDLRIHWAIAVRGLVLGWSSAILLGAFVAPFLGGPMFRLMNDRGLMMSVWRVHYYWDLNWGFACDTGLITGWIVGRAHRPHQAATVLAYASSLVLVSLPGLSRDMLNALHDPPAWSFALSIHATRCFITTLSIVLGGLWSGFAPEGSPKQSAI